MSKLIPIRIVVDMQNDFIDMALGTKEAKSIVPVIRNRCEETLNIDGAEVIFTRDTHGYDYLNTQEGSKLPVPHCIEGTEGWQIHKDLRDIADRCEIINKPTFGSYELAKKISSYDPKKYYVILNGVCTGICALSNAITIKSLNKEIKIVLEADACACVSQNTHKMALDVMQDLLQIEVVNRYDERRLRDILSTYNILTDAPKSVVVNMITEDLFKKMRVTDQFNVLKCFKALGYEPNWECKLGD